MKMDSKLIAFAIVGILVGAGIGIGAGYMVWNDEGTSDVPDVPEPEAITVKDGRGKNVTIASSSRVATTSVTVTEIVCGLGAYSKLAGVTDDSNNYNLRDYVIGLGDDGYPGIIAQALEYEHITNMGNMYMISAESVLTANPDLVIMGGYFNSDETITSLEGMGIPVVVCKDDNSLENIYFNIKLIGKALGMNAEADKLVQNMQSVVGKITGWVTKQGAPSKKIAVLMGFGSEYGTYGCGVQYLLGTPMIEMFNNTNAFGTTLPGMYDVVSKEAIVTANPDIIIDSMPMGRDVLDTVKTDEITKDLPAVVNDRIYGVFDLASKEYVLTTQSILNSLAIHVMFVFEDKLDFAIDNYMGDEYEDNLRKFWNQINA